MDIHNKSIPFYYYSLNLNPCELIMIKICDHFKFSEYNEKVSSWLLFFSITKWWHNIRKPTVIPNIYTFSHNEK